MIMLLPINHFYLPFNCHNDCIGIDSSKMNIGAVTYRM